MARRKKVNLTIEEQYEQITAEIAELKDQLAQKKEQLKEIEARKDEEDKQKIMQAYYNSGKSYDELLAFLNSDDAGEEEDQEY